MANQSGNINLINHFLRKGNVKKSIIIQVGAIIFAVLFSSYFTLWQQLGIFHAFTSTYYIILALILASFLTFLFLYVVLDKNFSNNISVFWALYFLIGFAIIMPTINAILVSTPASEFWQDDPKYLLQYSLFWIIIGSLYFLILISILISNEKGVR